VLQILHERSNDMQLLGCGVRMLDVGLPTIEQNVGADNCTCWLAVFQTDQKRNYSPEKICFTWNGLRSNVSVIRTG